MRLPDDLAAWFPRRPPVFPSANNEAAPVDQAAWEGVARPLPTNAWWTNMMLGDGTLPVLAAPYLVMAPPSGPEVGYPWPTVARPESVTSPLVFHWQIAAAEQLQRRKLISHDPLTVTLQWTAATRPSSGAAAGQSNGAPTLPGSITVPLAQGSPYVTAIYSRLTPSITTPPHAIVSPQPGSYRAASFTVSLNNGHMWRLYFSQAVQVTINVKGIHVTQPFTGALRLALVPSQGSLPQLDACSDTIAVSSTVHATISDTSAHYHFSWGTRSLCNDHGAASSTAPSPPPPPPQQENVQRQPSSRSHPGAGLLMLALPHHVDAQAASRGGVAAGLAGAFNGLLGPYTALLGQQWTMTEPLPDVEWQAPREPSAAAAATLRAALAQEADIRIQGTDPYFGASQAAAVGQQALIADMLQEPATAAKLRAQLKAALDLWLDPTARSPRLLYDTSWGGVVSAAGIKQAGADFGSGIYNDHHFHYGYLLYAAAALGAKDLPWLRTRAPALLDLVRDIANPRQGDTHFPFARHMDFYAGHSWASGLWGVWDIKNQESSSEAVHSYYSLALLGRALGVDSLTNWGQLLMAMEMRAAQKYYQVPSTSTVYPEPFKSNKVVGILWATKVDYTTFFGTNPEFIHCIQHIPYRPHSEALLPAAWINETLPVLLGAFSRADPPITPGFGAFVRLAQAVVDPEAAWQALQSWQWQWDGPHVALTRTAALWWAATRPGAAKTATA